MVDALMMTASEVACKSARRTPRTAPVEEVFADYFRPFAIAAPGLAAL